jgi:hypothetical protein
MWHRQVLWRGAATPFHATVLPEFTYSALADNLRNMFSCLVLCNRTKFVRSNLSGPDVNTHGSLLLKLELFKFALACSYLVVDEAYEKILPVLFDF